MAAGYDRYKDSNGVWWTMAPPDGSSWFMIGYVADTEQRAYEPDAPNLMAKTPEPDDIGRGVPAPTPDQARVIFLSLTSKIEDFAKNHQNQVVLRVRDHSDSIGWIVGLIIIIAAMSE